MTLVGEPDAGDPHVRFDEREVETEQGGILWPRQPKGVATRMAHLTHRATSRLHLCSDWTPVFNLDNAVAARDRWQITAARFFSLLLGEKLVYHESITRPVARAMYQLNDRG